MAITCRTFVLDLSKITLLVSLLIFSSCHCFPTTVPNACTVWTPEGMNVTNSFVTDLILSKQQNSSKKMTKTTTNHKTESAGDVLLSSVNCTGNAICKDFEIVGCDRIHCEGMEACEGTKILNFAHKVMCFGKHSCHRTEMESVGSSSVDDSVPMERNVVCQGPSACDVAVIRDTSSHEKDEFHVLCFGSKSCRRATISIAQGGTVTCTSGDSRYVACQGQTKIIAPCLYCDAQGCSELGGECRFTDGGKKGNGSEDHTAACIPDSQQGVCPPRTSDKKSNEEEDDENKN